MLKCFLLETENTNEIIQTGKSIICNFSSFTLVVRVVN